MRSRTIVIAAAIAIGALLTAWSISLAGEHGKKSARHEATSNNAKLKKRVAAQRIATAKRQAPSQQTPSRVVEPRLDSLSSFDDHGFSILHIGDSHTSANFFTGELRQRLQARFGDGGPGYITAGHPHIGVRSSNLKITTSSGWSYKSLQKPDAPSGSFWLSGYNSLAYEPGEVMTFTSDRAINCDLIEIETFQQPGGGSIEVSVNGKVVRQEILSSDDALVPRVIRISGAIESGLHEVAIRTTSRGPVTISSVGIYNRQSGLTYNSVGYVGATISLLNKFDETAFASDLLRLNPKIIVISFGTNEASNDQLDIARYSASYERVITRIQKYLPSAAIVLILPPDFNEASPGCRKDTIANSVCRPGPADISTPRGSNTSWDSANAAIAPSRRETSACIWRTPSKLNEVRAAQKEIADSNGLTAWNWSDLMPAECGAHEWFGMTPPLMSRDHVHMTSEGYKKSADSFLRTLLPIVERVSNLKASLSAK